METPKEPIWVARDLGNCSGCRKCEISCSLSHENRIWPEASRIRVFMLVPGLEFPHFCAQCKNYPCVEACPVKALSTDSKTSAVLVDEEKCTGCGLCALSCPTEALTFLSGDESDTDRLLFSHDYCIGCGACVRDCPEKCLRLEHVLELEQLGCQAIVLFEFSIGRCNQCGALIAPKPMLASLKSMILEQGGPTEHLELCPACRMSSDIVVTNIPLVE